MVLFFSQGSNAGARHALFSRPASAEEAGLCNEPSVEADQTSGPQRQEICRLVNSIRSWHSAEPLKLDAQLSETAQSFAKQMVNEGFFDHTTPDGKTMQARFKEAGITYRYSGENIARGSSEASDVMQLWMRSSSHKQNILQKHFRKIGVGYFDKHWVQIFTD
jgi:uncharacterized protein YkwD